MSEIDRLLTRYRENISVPWTTIRSDAERTLFVIYDRTKERQVRSRIGDFRLATEEGGKKWREFDVTDAFPRWFAHHPYRDEYFESPKYMPGFQQGDIREFEDDLVASLKTDVKEGVDAETVVAIVGVGALFGVAKVSATMKRLAQSVPGRLVVFFPGEKVDNNYRLLGARDGWSYLATAITGE